MNIPDIARKAQGAHAAGRGHISLLRRLGVQPSVAVVFVLLDWLLFGGEIFSSGVTLPVSILVGIVFGLWAIWRQKKAYGDTVPASIIKGVALGFLTAIPTPVASFFTIVAGLLPLFDSIGDKLNSPSPENPEPADNENPSMRNVTPPRDKSDEPS